MFLGFANFYHQFIQRFSRIAALLTSILKTSKSTYFKTRPKKSVVGVDGHSKAGHDGSKLERSEIDNGEVGGTEVDDEVGKKGQKTSKSKNLFKSKKSSKSKKAVGSLDFLTLKAKLTFIKLRQAFLKTSILHHFNPKRHIQIEIDALGYTIGGVLSQLTLDNLSQWYPLAFLSQKMILAETRYETDNNKFLAIIKAFKT